MLDLGGRCGRVETLGDSEFRSGSSRLGTHPERRQVSGSLVGHAEGRRVGGGARRRVSGSPAEEVGRRRGAGGGGHCSRERTCPRQVPFLFLPETMFHRRAWSRHVPSLELVAAMSINFDRYSSSFIAPTPSLPVSSEHLFVLPSISSFFPVLPVLCRAS